jgi:hypothetical protein
VVRLGFPWVAELGLESRRRKAAGNLSSSTPAPLLSWWLSRTCACYSFACVPLGGWPVHFYARIDGVGDGWQEVEFATSYSEIVWVTNLYPTVQTL